MVALFLFFKGMTGALAPFSYLMIILPTFVEFCNFMFLLLLIPNLSTTFRPVSNFGTFSLIIQKRWQKIKKSISQLPIARFRKYKSFFPLLSSLPISFGQNYKAVIEVISCHCIKKLVRFSLQDTFALAYYLQASRCFDRVKLRVHIHNTSFSS
jgi:D-alanyl-lipoteichoic acid acyltransferase DltB (MBOAT superfamily)